MSVRSRRAALTILVGLCLSLGACGDTLQSQPFTARSLESLVLVETSPVYWLGGSFRGLAISEVNHDPGGAYTLQYGDCVMGGQNSCAYPLSIVTSLDNSFRPGGEAPRRSVSLRGAHALVLDHGRTITLTTGEVVVSIYADSATLAQAAAETMVPINRVGSPHSELPDALADTGFARTPNASQRPPLTQAPPSVRGGRVSR